jgi:hypothetical protein
VIKVVRLFAVLSIVLVFTSAIGAQSEDVPKTIADSVGGALRHSQGQFLAVAQAMPESKYTYIPTSGNFNGVRSFGEQVKHVACAIFASFNIEGRMAVRSPARYFGFLFPKRPPTIPPSPSAP